MREVAKILQFRLVEHPLGSTWNLPQIRLAGPYTREKIRHPLVLGGALGRRLKPSGEAALLSPEGPADRQSMLSNLHALTRRRRRIAGLQACRLSRMRHPSVALRMALFAHMT